MNELDNRGSHFYLALYWAQALATQTDHPELRDHFQRVAAELSDGEPTIVAELNSAQGRAVDLGGYFLPDPEKAEAAMRPSPTFNAIIQTLLD